MTWPQFCVALTGSGVLLLAAYALGLCLSVERLRGQVADLSEECVELQREVDVLNALESGWSEEDAQEWADWCPIERQLRREMPHAQRLAKLMDGGER